MTRNFTLKLILCGVFIKLVSCQVANTLDTYIASYCSEQFMSAAAIESVEDCFDQAIGVNPIIARRCKNLNRTPLERKRSRCSIKPIPSSLSTAMISQCFIREATNTGDQRTVNEVRRIQSIMDSFNFLLIRGFMRSQASQLEQCLRSAFAIDQERPLQPGGQFPPRPQPYPVSGQYYGPSGKVRVRRQAYGPGGYGNPYDSYPGYGGYPDYPNYNYQPNNDPYRPYNLGRNERYNYWRNRERQINRDLRSLGYTR